MEYNNFPNDYLHLDSQDILAQYRTLAIDIRKAYTLGDEFQMLDLKEQIDNIFFIGMGGSAISFDLLKSYLTHLGINKTITVIKDYSLPNTVTKNSLVFVASYSGNTEETISAYRNAFRITQNIYALSSGGKLEEVCRLNKTPFILLPTGYQPRTAAISFMFFPFIKILERMKILGSQSESITHITSTVGKSTFQDLAINISEKLVDKVPLIYSSTKMYPVAYRLKTAINENAKVHAFAHSYSELNHNEIIGFSNLKAEYHIITFRFNQDYRRIQKRMDLMKEITNEKGVATTEIALNGDDYLTKLFSAILIGDLTAIYLALRYKTDPSPVEIIEEFKKNLGSIVY